MRVLILLCLINISWAKSLYLTKEDQKHYQNDSFQGKNDNERIDLNVKEINRLWEELRGVKQRVLELEKINEENKNKK